MAEGEVRLREALSRALEAGYQLSPSALNLLASLPPDVDPEQVVETALKQAKEDPDLLVLDEELLRSVLPEEPKQEEALGEACLFEESIGPSRKAYAAEVEERVEVLMNPTEHLAPEGTVEGYLRYFRDRFVKLESLLRRRMDARDAVSISSALRMPANTRVKVIGMVSEKREREGKILITLEDFEAQIRVLVSPSSGEGALKKARSLVLDQVVCVSGVKLDRGLILADNIIWPDLPQRQVKTADEPVYAALLSDLHYGSKTFMADAVDRMLSWLSGRLGNGGLQELAGRVKYLLIAGDLVDGVGVYPGQRDELSVESLYEQYRGVAALLERVPEHIAVIIIPGNHDASRKALPQPAISKEYAEPLYETLPVYSLGNPALVRIHGVDVLLYHGQSLDDLSSTVPGLSFHEPCRAMRLMLQARHLAPIYGGKTSLAPEAQDFLVITHEPAVMHVGHVHVYQHETYRGTVLVNSGAWQEQTSYQKRMGLEPTPGILPIINLQTLELIALDFTKPQIAVLK